MGNATERSIAEQLTRSIRTSLNVYPYETESANDRANNGMMSYTDYNDVIYDSCRDAEGAVKLWDWERSVAHAYLVGYFQTALGQQLVAELQSKVTGPRLRLDDAHFQIVLVDRNRNYETLRKVWCRIEPLRIR